MAAAITPSTTYRESLGSLTLIIAKFANTLDTGDTWDSGIPGIVAHWAVATDVPGTQTNSGVAVSESSDTFTFSPDEDNQAVTL
jgi:hypothetical protein